MRVFSSTQTAREVYFLFSVNGSGEFFGYATMTSEIQQLDDAPLPPPNLDLSDSITNQLTSQEKDTAAQARSRAFSSTSSETSLGSVHYEPERRRIIWEATHNSLEPGDEFSPEDWSPLTPFDSPRRKHGSPKGVKNNDYFPPFQPMTTTTTTKATTPRVSGTSTHTPGAEVENISSPCHIRWLSTQNVPFDEFRGLKNAWNDNKEIHIARNVTAVEPGAGAEFLKRWKSKAEAKRLAASTEAISRAWPGT